MDIQDNASTTPHGRLLIVRRLGIGWPVAAVAAELGMCPKTESMVRDRMRETARATCAIVSVANPAEHRRSRIAIAAD